MAKRAIYDVLESTIGRYVHNLDTSSLNVALWSGKIELHDLRLDASAVNARLTRQALEAPNLAVPFRIVSGKFDGLEVSVPWSKLTSKPVVFSARGLTVQLEPWDHLKNDEEDEGGNGGGGNDRGGVKKGKKRPRGGSSGAARANAIRDADEIRRKYNAVRNLTGDGGESAEGSSAAVHSSSSLLAQNEEKGGESGFVARLVRRIIENLQLEISDVMVELRGCRCSTGLVLQSLCLFSTDAKGKRAFVDRGGYDSAIMNKKTGELAASAFLHKDLHISGLGLYCDDGEYRRRTLVATTTSSPSEGHSYILSPLSFRASLRQCDAPARLRPPHVPQYAVSSQLPRLSIMVSRTQLELIRGIFSALSPAGSRPLFPEYRPVHRPLRGKQAVTDWWRYAVRCVGRLTRRRSWVEFFIAFRKRRRYVDLYKRYLTTATATATASVVSEAVGNGESGGKTTTRTSAAASCPSAHGGREGVTSNGKSMSRFLSAKGVSLSSWPLPPPGELERFACPWMRALTEFETAEMVCIESDASISVEGIMMWRNLSESAVLLEKRKRREQQRQYHQKIDSKVSVTVEGTPRRKSNSDSEREFQHRVKSPVPATRATPTRATPKKMSLLGSIFGGSSGLSSNGGSGGGDGFVPLREDGGGSMPYLDDGEDDKEDNDGEPPITLTPEEWRELEEVAYQNPSANHSSSSADGVGVGVGAKKLYDVQFALQSFKIDLLASRMQTLAKLSMGTVGLIFDANADGSLGFGLTLSSLRVDDMLTCGSLFPGVVRSLNNQFEGDTTAEAFTACSRRPPPGQSGKVPGLGSGTELIPDATLSSSSSDSQQPPVIVGAQPQRHAFEFELNKNRNGDAHVTLKLVAFELVASAPLLKGLKNFFMLSEEPSSISMVAPSSSCVDTPPGGGMAMTKNGGGVNPHLEESVSGKFDLFYDADEGMGRSALLLGSVGSGDKSSGDNGDDDSSSPSMPPPPSPQQSPGGAAATSSSSSYSRRLLAKSTATATATAMDAAAAAMRETSVSEKLSGALADMWEEQKAAHGGRGGGTRILVDCDVHAPIVVVPECCTDTNATVLVLDLGRLCVRTRDGDVPPSSRVRRWLENSRGVRSSKTNSHNNSDEQHRLKQANEGTVTVEYWKMEMTNLKLLLGKAGARDWGPSPSDGKGDGDDLPMKTSCSSFHPSRAIVEPLSITLDVGIERNGGETDGGGGGGRDLRQEGQVPLTPTMRTCVDGVLQAICVRVAPFQVSDMLKLFRTWSCVVGEITAVSGSTAGGVGDDKGRSERELMISSALENGMRIIDEARSTPDKDKMSVAETMSAGSASSPSPPPVRRFPSPPLSVERGDGEILPPHLSLKSSSSSKAGEEKDGGAITAAVAGSAVYEHLHVTLALRRLSAHILTRLDCDDSDEEEGIEAHLVSAVVSTTLSTDGSSSKRACMGWFWILDRLPTPEKSFPRVHRLVAHSTLPVHPSRLLGIGCGKKNDGESRIIMAELRRLGVFEANYVGSTDLADIVVNTPPQHVVGEGVGVGEDEAAVLGGESFSRAAKLIDATFTSLFINWNPYAIKRLLAMQSIILDRAMAVEGRNGLYGDASSGCDDEKVQDGNQRRESSEIHPRPSRTTSLPRSSHLASPSLPSSSGKGKTFVAGGATVVNARMNKLEISLNSAKDDLLLYRLTMAGTKLDLQMMTMSSSSSSSLSDGCGDRDDHEETEESMIALVEVGDFRMETPSGRRMKTLPSYRTILGLAPNQSTSLLTVRYYKGALGVASSGMEGNIKDRASECECCAFVQLSPMRFVHLHAQVLTLVEYLTEGVLGALAAQVASSAAAAAVEMARSVAKEKIFCVNATGFEFVLPQAASDRDRFVFWAGHMDTTFRSLANFGGSLCGVNCRDMTVECGRSVRLARCPISLDVDVSLPPNHAPTEEDRAMRINLRLSEASFLLTKDQYRQAMRTLTNNIGEMDSFLREETPRDKKEEEFWPLPTRKVGGSFEGGGIGLGGSNGNEAQGKRSDSTGASTSSSSKRHDIAASKRTVEGNKNTNLTHAGVEAVVIVRRMYTNLDVGVLSLTLCGRGPNDAIMELAAVQSHISLKLLPDESTFCAEFKMSNLVVEDRREISMDRYFRRLFSQSSPDDAERRMIEGKEEEFFSPVVDAAIPSTTAAATAIDKENEEDDDDDVQDVFHLRYNKHDNGSTELTLNVGKPQLVILPDVISEAVNFARFSDAAGPPPSGAGGGDDHGYDDNCGGEVDGWKAEDESKRVVLPEGSGGVGVDAAAYGAEQQEEEDDEAEMGVLLMEGSRDEIETTIAPLRPNPATMISKISIQTSTCTIVLVDVGSAGILTSADDVSSCANDKGGGGGSVSGSVVKGQLTETFVLQGRVDAAIRTTRLADTGVTVESEARMNADRFEVYTAQGRMMRTPVQIMEPSSLSFFVTKSATTPSLSSILKKDNDYDFVSSDNVTVKVVTLSPVNISFSMQNAALLNAIVSSVNSIGANSATGAEAVDDDIGDNVDRGGGGELNVRPLTEMEKSRVERLSYALDHNDEAWKSESTVGGDDRFKKSDMSIGQDSDISVSAHGGGPTGGGGGGGVAFLGEEEQRRDDGGQKNRENHYVCNFDLHVTLPEANVTIINDFRGLDQALFRIFVRNAICTGVKNDYTWAKDRTKFRVFVNSSILADYFDSASNRWEKLLLKPWETTVNFERTDDHRFRRRKRIKAGGVGVGVERMLTELEVESHKCLVSFSEQFLVSLGAATRMWSVYSGATRDGHGGCKQRQQQQHSPSPVREKPLGHLSTATTRALVVPTPYGIDNQTGVTAYYAIQPQDSVHSERLLCEAGRTQYFRFEYPRGRGRGGERLYGQDVSTVKSLEVYIGSGSIFINQIDEEANVPRRAHDVGGGWIIFTDVVKTGRATVLRLRSRIHIHNCTSLSFGIAVQSKEGIRDVGMCGGTSNSAMCRRGRRKALRMSSSLHDPASASATTRSGSHSDSYPATASAVPSLGIPVDLLRNFVTLTPSSQSEAGLTVLVCPSRYDEKNRDCGDGVTPEPQPSAQASFYAGDRTERWGAIALPPPYVLAQMAAGMEPISTIDVICAPVGMAGEKSGNERGEGDDEEDDCLMAEVCLKVSVVDGIHPFVELFVRPRAVLENCLPVSILVRTPASHTFSVSNRDIGMKGRGNDADGDKDKDDGSDALDSYSRHAIHRLEPNEGVEIFTSGYSIPVSAMCADKPAAGGVTGWLQGLWVDLPLGRNRIPCPLRLCFPFVGSTEAGEGIEVFLSEEDDMLKLRPPELEQVGMNKGNFSGEGDSSGCLNNILVGSNEHPRTLSFSVCNYVIDHTGQVLFERCLETQVLSASQTPRRQRRKRFAESYASTSEIHSTRMRVHNNNPPPPWSAFSCPRQRRRITMLPDSRVRIRLVQLAIMNGRSSSEGLRRSLPIRIDDISISGGGVESSAILWEDNSKSGYYAYRRLISYNQSEIHIVPEFVVFNGANYTAIMNQFNMLHTSVPPRTMSPITGIPNHGLTVSIEFPDFYGKTPSVRVDSLGIKVCVVKSIKSGLSLGSLTIQTIVGGENSRVVVKIGSMKFGGDLGLAGSNGSNDQPSMFINDYQRYRVRWSYLQVTLNDTQSAVDEASGGGGGRSEAGVIEAALDRYTQMRAPGEKDRTWVEARKKHDESYDKLTRSARERLSYATVAQIIFQRFTVDYQRIFKDNNHNASSSSSLRRTKEEMEMQGLEDPERSQLAVIVHNMTITDCNPNTPCPIVFESKSESSFIDLCIRFRGPLDADLVKVDLIDLSIAYSRGGNNGGGAMMKNKLVINTSEDFIWRLLDVANRILMAISELTGVNLDVENDGARLTAVGNSDGSVAACDSMDEGYYKPPRSDRLYDIRTARVSPVKFVVSFKRQPQTSRYKMVSGVRGAKLMNYFTRQLKFTVDNAELNFAGFRANNVKGPPSTVMEMVTAVYVSRMKYQLVSLMGAMSIQEWKTLTAREHGDNEYVEGDILRMTGNVMGRGAGYVFKKAGEGLGDGVIKVTSGLGDGIEHATELIGVGIVGAGVNSVVSGLGGGVGSTLQGVGTGTSHLIKGAGKGVGQIAGGLGGGVQLAAKGFGRGFANRDGRAIVSGLTDGAASVGKGVGQGFETAFHGAADGVLNVGNGLLTGITSVGKGIGDAFTQKDRRERKRQEQEQQQQQQRRR